MELRDTVCGHRAEISAVDNSFSYLPYLIHSNNKVKVGKVNVLAFTFYFFHIV